MYADELKTVFHRDGFTLTGFVGPDPGSKEDKLYTLSDLHKLSTVFDDGKLHAGKTTICTAQWERIGNETEDSSAYYTKADDGTVKIESVDQDELKEQLKTGSTAQIGHTKTGMPRHNSPTANRGKNPWFTAPRAIVAAAAITSASTVIRRICRHSPANDPRLLALNCSSRGMSHVADVIRNRIKL